MTLFTSQSASGVGPDKRSRGFTLLELIIVIAILAILAVVITLALNPAETLARARDSQRLSDLSSLKSAISLSLAEATTINLDNASGNVNCADATDQNARRIWYSFSTAITDATAPAARGTDAEGGAWCTGAGCTIGAGWAKTPAATDLTKVDGNGWVPINMAAVPGGPAIPALPLDPQNKLGAAGTVTTEGTTRTLAYRYSCTETLNTGYTGYQVPPPAYEINAVLESTRFGPGGDQDKVKTDGGDNLTTFEVGTSLRILPTANDF